MWVLREPPAHWGWLAPAEAQGGVLQRQLVPLLEPEAVSAPPVDLISAEPTAPAVPQAGSLLDSAQSGGCSLPGRRGGKKSVPTN